MPSLKNRLNDLLRPTIPADTSSKTVPTEYDVSLESLYMGIRNRSGRVLKTIRTPFWRVVLSDDRNRMFYGRTYAAAFAAAESAQDINDKIHHPPFPDPDTTALPDQILD